MMAEIVFLLIGMALFMALLAYGTAEVLNP